MAAITVRKGTQADAGALAALAAATFREAFAADNVPDDLELHVARSFGVALQATELADPSIVTLLASAGDELTGFAQLRTGEPPPCVGSAEAVELWRLYVSRSWHGHGVAQALIQEAIDAALALGAPALWLGVWEHNLRAQAFYRKTGFVEVGSKVFVLGTDVQTDLVMARVLAPP